MVSTRKVRVGEVLVEEGIITKEQLDGLLAEQKGSGRFLGEILVEQGYLDDEEVFLAEDVSVDHTHRIKGPDGTIYRVTGCRKADRIDALLEIDVVRVN